LFDNFDEATPYADNLGKGHYIEKREGVNMCSKYCPVRHICGIDKGAKIIEEEDLWI
jgi:hypothetical protein